MRQRLGLLILLWLAPVLGQAATFVVTSAADTAGSTCASSCTLRQAINAANATPAADTINFAISIPPRGDILIAPGTSLPTITQPLTINGYSQSGTRENDDPAVSNATLRIRLDGAAIGALGRGLASCASSFAIRGLAFTRFNQSAISNGVDNTGTACAAGTATIEGNFIGLSGSGALVGTGLGVRGLAPIIVGGVNPAQRNVIANTSSNAISLGSNSGGSLVNGNLLGTDRSGADLALGADGIAMIDDGGQAIGTLAPNVIRNFARAIRVSGNIGGLDFANNQIGNSAVLGIDLNGDGVTANDANDLDSGPNSLQNFPVITAAVRSAGVSVTGTLDVGHPGSLPYTLTTYASASCHPSGHGEGERILGQTVRNFSSTNESFSYTQLSSDPLPPGTVVTMTATRAGIGTSEFSACFGLDPAPLVVNTSDDVADGVCNASHCSLRDAIIASNAATGSGLSRIHFAVPPLAGTSEIVIAPTSALPNITRTVLIDGYTQPGTAVNTDPQASNAVLRIRLDGASAPSGAIGLAPCVASTIRGLSITRFGTAIQRSCGSIGNVEISGNFIGLATDGSTVFGNTAAMSISSGRVRLGGTTPAGRNVVSGNDNGLLFVNAGSSGSEVLGNLIGTDRSGTLDRGHSTPALLIDLGVTNLLVGSAQAPNLLAYNLSGVRALGNTQSRLGQNRYRANDGLGIDIGGSGITPNDPGDGDQGPNGLHNFPVLSLAERRDNGIRVAGSLDAPGTPEITVYASTQCHVGGHGQGEELLGSFTPGSSVFDFSLVSDVDLTVFDSITATATGTEGTSEFSACIAVTDPPPGIAVDTATDSTLVDAGCDAVGDANNCTLREAILLANANAGTDAIRFSIPGEGPHIINTTSQLPAITGSLLLDGYSQAGAAPNAASQGSDAVLKIEVRGSGSVANVLRLCTGETVIIRGLALNGGSSAVLHTQSNDANNCTLTPQLFVEGNHFGLTAAGGAATMARAIISRASVGRIGSSALAERNLFANAAIVAIDLQPPSAANPFAPLQVQNNLFGRDADLQASLPNTRDIVIGVAGTRIGGDGAEANHFFGSSHAIIVAAANADQNELYGNRFSQHAGATAIDLSDSAVANGIDVNDPDDADAGANDGQNAPVLTSASATGGTLNFVGSLDVPGGSSTPVNYRISFYRSSSCSDSSGSNQGREGEVYLGTVQPAFTSTSEGFSVSLNGVPEAGFITALATAPDGSTSEFSNCLVAPRPEAVFSDGFE